MPAATSSPILTSPRSPPAAPRAAPRHEPPDLDAPEAPPRLDQHLAGLGVGDLDGRRPGVRRGLGVLVLDDAAVLAALADPLRQTALGAAVVLTDDDVLRHVDQATREVARVGGAQRGVGETLA